MRRNSTVLAGLALAALVVVAASSAADVPITQAASGKVFRIAKGESATLRLSNRWHWSEPQVSTGAIELTPVEYFVDPGFREWTVDTHRTGRVTISAVGRPNRAATTRHFLVTVLVTAGA
jgi:hypothetical protein